MKNPISEIQHGYMEHPIASQGCHPKFSKNPAKLFPEFSLFIPCTPIESYSTCHVCWLESIKWGFPQMEVPCGTPKWMVSERKSDQNWWFRGTHIFGNTQITIFASNCPIHPQPMHVLKVRRLGCTPGASRNVTEPSWIANKWLVYKGNPIKIDGGTPYLRKPPYTIWYIHFDNMKYHSIFYFDIPHYILYTIMMTNPNIVCFI